MKTATVVAVCYMVVVAIFAVPFALIGLLAAPASGSNAGGVVGGVLVIAVGAIVLYGLLGWIFTAVAAAVYNLAAGWVGGIEVQVETVEPPPPMPAWTAPTQTPPPATPPAAPPSNSPPAEPGSSSPSV